MARACSSSACPLHLRELHARWAAAWLRWVSERRLPLMLSDPLRELSARQRAAWAAAVERWRAAQDGEL